MATTSSRVLSSGILSLNANGSFDEVTFNPNASANAVVNLFDYSQEFTNAYWATSAGNVTANTVVAPDGTLTGSTFTATAAFSSIAKLLPSPSVGQVITFSVYVKNGNITPGAPQQYFTLVNEISGATGINPHVQTWDLATATPSTPSNLISSSITPVGNGWYRCSITFTYLSTAYVFRPRIWMGTYTGTNYATSFVYLWGAQIEYGSVLTPYQPKVASTNLLNYSTDLTNTFYWIKNPGTATVTANAAIAPDGTLSAFKFVANAGITGRKSLYQAKNVSANTKYTWSLYVKSAGFANTSMWMDPTPASLLPNIYQGASSLISLSNGTKGGASPNEVTVIPVGNDWYRLSTTATTTTTTTSVNLTVALGDPNGSGTAVGDGVSGIFIWGPQFEKVIDPQITPFNNIPTAYKPTTLNTNIVLPRFVKRDSANTYYIAGQYDEVTYNANSTNALYNIFPYSEDWTKNIQSQQNSTIASANTVAPDGSFTGTRITSTITGGTNTALIQKLIAIPASQLTNNLPWCYSVYVKQGTSPAVTMVVAFNNGLTFKGGVLTLTWSTLALTIAGSVNQQVGGPGNYGVIDVGGGWYRLWYSITNNYNANQVSARVHVRDSGSSNVLGEYSYIWGAQVEQSNYPSIYQPTISTSTSPTESVSSPSVLTPPRFANRITNTGDSYVKREYDEWTGVPITDGLVLYADAAVSSSYTPGSTTWNNLANTSTNGIVYGVSGGNGGIGSASLTSNNFDYDYSTMSLKINDTGVDANCQIRFANIDYNALATSNNFTVMFAAKKDYYGLAGNLGGNSELFQAVNQGYNSGWRISEGSQGTPGRPFTGTHYWGIEMSPAATPSGWSHYVSDSSSNRWCIVALSISPTNVYAFCNNNITTRANPGTYYGGASPTNRGWINFTGAGAGSFNGRLGFFMVYNRALSNTEMTYNFNQFRRRYGL
jgi:hypothetical protein